MATTQDAAPAVPAPLAHAVLLVLAVLPLFVLVPTNVNIVLTAAATVFCGSWRSVKSEPPVEAMTKKVRAWGVPSLAWPGPRLYDLLQI